jgi:hypothetical protein
LAKIFECKIEDILVVSEIWERHLTLFLLNSKFFYIQKNM